MRTPLQSRGTLVIPLSVLLLFPPLLEKAGIVLFGIFLAVNYRLTLNRCRRSVLWHRTDRRRVVAAAIERNRNATVSIARRGSCTLEGRVFDIL